MNDILITPEIKAQHNYLRLLSPAQQDSEEIVWESMQNHGQFRAVQYASERIRGDYDFMTKSIVQFNSWPYIYCTPELKKNKKLVLIAAKLVGLNLDFAEKSAPEMFDVDFCQELIEHMINASVSFNSDALTVQEKITSLLSKDVFLPHSKFFNVAIKAIKKHHPQLLTLDVVSKILTKKSSTMGLFGPMVCDNFLFIEKFIRAEPSLIEFAGPGIAKNKTLVVELINGPNGGTIELGHLDKMFYEDKELVLLVMQKTHNPFLSFKAVEESLKYDLDVWSAIFSRPGFNCSHKDFYEFFKHLSLEYRANLIKNEADVLSNTNWASLDNLKNDLSKSIKGLGASVAIFERVFQDYIDNILSIEVQKRDLELSVDSAIKSASAHSKKI